MDAEHVIAGATEDFVQESIYKFTDPHTWWVTARTNFNNMLFNRCPQHMLSKPQ